MRVSRYCADGNPCGTSHGHYMFGNIKCSLVFQRKVVLALLSGMEIRLPFDMLYRSLKINDII